MDSKDGSSIYEPEEDSYLLAEQVKKYAKGKVLDVGTGSGIQGNAAKKNSKVISVTYSDINPEVKRHIKDAIITDLFTGIKGRYNTIIFNPPYLPEDENDDEKLITTGGKHGYEIIGKFLKQAKHHLEPEGVILLVFSSLTDKTVVDEMIKGSGYKKIQLSTQGLFMEQLYVYMIQNSKDIMKGQRGIVEVKKVGNKLVAIKRKKNESYNPSMEANFLKILNRHGIGPKLMGSNSTSITMEYIEGERIVEYFGNHDKKDILSVIKLILDQLFVMDGLNINKLELTNPYKHIIVRDNKPYQIDFERCIYTEKPKNVTQFIQFLTSGRLGQIFKEKDVHINTDRLLKIAQAYKENHDKRYFNEIMKNIN